MFSSFPPAVVGAFSLGGESTFSFFSAAHPKLFDLISPRFIDLPLLEQARTPSFSSADLPILLPSLARKNILNTLSETRLPPPPYDPCQKRAARALPFFFE